MQNLVTSGALFFPVCAKLRIKDVYLASFFPVFFQRPTAQAPEPMFTDNTSKDVVSRKDVPFWVTKQKLNI